MATEGAVKAETLHRVQTRTKRDLNMVGKVEMAQR